MIPLTVPETRTSARPPAPARRSPSTGWPGDAAIRPSQPGTTSAPGSPETPKTTQSAMAHAAAAGCCKDRNNPLPDRVQRENVSPMATATRLTPQQRRSLKDDGYLLVPSLLGGADLARITARLAEHVRRTVATWADDPSLDTHEACVCTRFHLDDSGLAPCYQHPLLANAAATVLADAWHLQNLEMRAPIPGPASRACTRTSQNAAPGPRGRNSRPCGASASSPATTGRCG